MPNPPRHFRFNAPIACADKASRLRMAAVPDLLAKSGAEEVTPQKHSALPRDLSGGATKKQSRILTYPELKLLKGIPYTRQHLDRLEKSDEFPGRIQISAGRIGWLEDEIDEWLGSKADARKVKG